MIGTGRTALEAMVNAGMSDPAIAASLGVSARTVLRWRIRDGLASQWQPPVPEHGTMVRYRPPYGCRCDACRRANAASQTTYRNQAQAVTRPTAIRGHRPWTPEEDAVVMGPGGNAAKALQLGRTHNAVVQRRTVLNNRSTS